jgi:hypothetical protein
MQSKGDGKMDLPEGLSVAGAWLSPLEGDSAVSLIGESLTKELTISSMALVSASGMSLGASATGLGAEGVESGAPPIQKSALLKKKSN